VIGATWQPGTPGHLRLSVPLEETAEVERVDAAGRRVNLFADDRPGGWIRVLELHRVGVRDGEVVYLLAFAACGAPAPPNQGGRDRRRAVAGVRSRVRSGLLRRNAVAAALTQPALAGSGTAERPGSLGRPLIRCAPRADRLRSASGTPSRKKK
jgi:hypothetical protein